MTNVHRNPEAALDALNRRLADILSTPPMELSRGGVQASEDRLWVWGIVGGKDVGKTTLINALAGADVVARGEDVGEGTFAPSAYLNEADLVAATARFAEVESVSVNNHANAPAQMRGVVLVDLPDFDSFFADHAEQVRRIAGVLDGIIWVTTPKKIGDLRGIKEIQRVLKSRSNFVYAVNKIDWLLAQSPGAPDQELDRVGDALRRQVEACDPGGANARAFLVSARYRDEEKILAAIATQRDATAGSAAESTNGELAQAAQRVLADFDQLRSALTTPPTAEAARANKEANLAYQVQRQAEQLLAHHRPRRTLARLEAAADADTVRQAVVRSFSPGYCAQVFERLNAGRLLFAEWSAELFKARVAQWPLLGLVAWPLMLIGSVLGGLRSLIPAGASREDSDPFRADGLSLEERADAVVAHIRQELASIADRVQVDVVSPETLARQLRSETASAAQDHRDLIVQPLLSRRAGVVGRFFRGLIPLALLLWFPLIQPLLASILRDGDPNAILHLDLETLAIVVRALSADQVLQGLAASLLLLAAMVAAIYSRAVGDALGALDRLRRGAPDAASAALIESLTHTVRKPIEVVRSVLADATEQLESMASEKNSR